MRIIDTVQGAEYEVYSIIDSLLAMLSDSGSRGPAIKSLNNLHRYAKYIANIDEYVSFYDSVAHTYEDQASSISDAPTLAERVRGHYQSIRILNSMPKPPYPKLKTPQVPHATVSQIAQMTLFNMQAITPKYTGALVRSSSVEILKGGFIISYDAPYATRIHEDMSIAHPYHTHNGELYNCEGSSKFVEIVLARLVSNNPLVVFHPSGGISAYVKLVAGEEGAVHALSVATREELTL